MTERGDVLSQRLEGLERLVRELEDGPDSPVRARARRLVEGVLDLHAEAVRRMIDVLNESDDGRRILHAWASDPGISAVLLLHGLHPLTLESRVHEALDALAPSLRGLGARVAAVSFANAVVHIRVEHEGGRATPASVLRARLEEALIAAAPDATAIEVDVPVPPAAFVPLGEVRLRPRAPEGRAR